MTNKKNPFIEGFLRGDPAIFNEIYNNTFKNIVRFIVSRGGTEKEAEDIFQNSLIHLYVKLKEEELHIDSFENYLFIVCRNLWRSESAKKNRVTKLDAIPLVSDEIDKAIFYAEQSQWELYKEKFELLSEQCQNILKMTFNKKSYAEIVEVYKYASQTVARQRVFKCKTRLIKLIKKDRRYILFKK
jgi:RNA polymerase sigma factor (sigma-70 family)